jgi:hypothetical protein
MSNNARGTKTSFHVSLIAKQTTSPPLAVKIARLINEVLT